MILTKELLTKGTKKGRATAVNLLNDFARFAQLPQPHYEYNAGGSTKRRWHYYKVRFRVPKLLQEADKDGYLFEYTIRGGEIVVSGSGKASKKIDAKSLAALEVVHRLEESLQVSRNGLPDLLEQYRQNIKDKQASIEATPVTEEIKGVSWTNLPMDGQFSELGGRKGRIIFSQSVLNNPKALLGARAITLTSRNSLPTVVHHSNHRDQLGLQNWANIVANGKIKGVNGPVDKELYGLSKPDAEEVALEVIGAAYRYQTNPDSKRFQKKLTDVAELLEDRSTSFGMAKLFVKLPKHRFEEIKKLSDEIEDLADSREESGAVRNAGKKRRTHCGSAKEDEALLKERVASFRSHQKKLPLPVDQVERQIPDDAAVTIVRGGTGSGKTTRYPLMLSLFQESDGAIAPKIVVAQPRRLACQTAAQRVAFEQDVQISAANCPIGYSIRFESRPSTASGRTVDFETPGVILRRAAQDPLLSNLTHLVIDEVHERNADMDLLLALAKHAQVQRVDHPTLEPLRIVLMSATIDTDQWEAYFDETEVVVVDVPDARRFPIDVIHAGDKAFPERLSSTKWLVKGREKSVKGLDEKLCQACAELIRHLFHKSELLGGGSILCFLPGMEEIRAVSRIIRTDRQMKNTTICFLHSSLSSKEQAKVFLPGTKVILSTNIAETSITIPDVKIVVDSGRERQYSLLESTSESSNTEESVKGLDEKLCQACAELIRHLFHKSELLGGGSILCFLPGMEEIRAVSRIIRTDRQMKSTTICFLHSSLSSKEQAKVFLPGTKVILSTNIAETSLTIPNVKIVVDSGRERQYSLLESTSKSSNTSVVGSQLAIVDISQASAKQRAGRAGRVSAGTCYRLYTRQDFESSFSAFPLPEMQRMELSQLVLHSLSLYHPTSGHPLSLLLGAPDPPSHVRLKQSLRAMSQQSLLIFKSKGPRVDQMDISLTQLGQAVSEIPAPPRIGRMLFMGLALRAIDPALTIAALLSVPKAFGSTTHYDDESNQDLVCSDVIVRLASFEKYLNADSTKRERNKDRFIFDQVLRVRRQLEKSFRDRMPKTVDWSIFNANERRVAAQAALICGATPHIAHLIGGKGSFATRDAPGTARIHPNSINFDHSRRCHWYLYHELRTTKVPYMHVTTAASPLELALFCDSSVGLPKNDEVDSTDVEDIENEDQFVEDWDDNWDQKDEW
eukprot:CAMPEP_0113474346 /NCGR_PEP_ID=MMETSP0014_2-20120614/18534_1 /TAXON_ID=2857 /ORGANISM="Nitzschia sp." /LENGTH=1187 /DNA_ID=CAMNT_0000367185 /DNA_START=121 /DNA_END=3681 /DNA_ORIENTATION=- /assembly_acc=CAM_ASM_000159